VDLGWLNGKRVRKRITRPTRREVVVEMRELVRQAELGRLTATRPPTLASWLDVYFTEVAASRVRPTTLAGYKSLADLHVIPALGRQRIDRLRPQDIAGFYRERGKVLAPASVRRIHAMLRRALKVAVRWGLIQVNPVTMVDPPPITQTEIEPLTLDDARTLLAAAATHRLNARWVVGLSLGLRQGEVLGLQWSDIDLEHGFLHVRRSLRRQPDGTLSLTKLKTTRSDRSMPMPRPVIQALESHRDQQASERSVLGTAWHESDFVFTTALGTPVHPRNDYRAFQAPRQGGTT
jgi:integrase